MNLKSHVIAHLLDLYFLQYVVVGDTSSIVVCYNANIDFLKILNLLNKLLQLIVVFNGSSNSVMETL